jgi:hypothetical protein
MLLQNGLSLAATTTGTTSFQLGSATAGYETFANKGLRDKRIVFYWARNGTSEWEHGIGVYSTGSPDILTRPVILESSNSDAIVSFTAAPTIYVDMPADMFNQWNVEALYGANLAAQVGWPSQAGAATITYPTPTAPAPGALNLASAATANADARAGPAAGNAGIRPARATTDILTGFWYEAVIGLPDSSYGTGATGARIAWGLGDSNGTPHGLVADTPTTAATNSGGLQFQYSTNRADTNWQVCAIKNDGGTTTAGITDTGLAFAANGSWWRGMFLSRPAVANEVIWMLERQDAAGAAAGRITTNLAHHYGPYHQLGVRTLTTVARNIRVRGVRIMRPA